MLRAYAPRFLPVLAAVLIMTGVALWFASEGYRPVSVLATVPVPGSQTVDLDAGTYTLGYRGGYLDCWRDLRNVPNRNLLNSVQVTRLTDTAPLALAQIDPPSGICDHGTWTGALYQFEVMEPGQYELAGEPIRTARQPATLMITAGNPPGGSSDNMPNIMPVVVILLLVLVPLSMVYQLRKLMRAGTTTAADD